MFADWMWTSWTRAGLVALSSLLMVVVVIAVIRFVIEPDELLIEGVSDPSVVPTIGT